MTINWRKHLKDWGITLGVVVVALTAWNMGWIPALGGETHMTGDGPRLAADFVVPDVAGQGAHTLNAYRGQVVLVNFWATWCPPCRVEIPGFIALYEKQKAKGFTIIGVALDQGGAKDVLPYVRDHGITYPVGIGHQQVVNDYGGIRGIPTSFLIDRQGRIVKKYTGLLSGARLERDMQDLL